MMAAENDAVSERLVITGGSGAVAALIRPLLADRGWEVTLVDVRPPTMALGASERFVEGSVTDLQLMTEVLDGSTMLVHLGGLPREDTWANILDTNIHGGYVALEASHRAGVRHVLLASSVHAVGYHRAEDVIEVREPRPNPDTFYGVGKVALEALGRVYAQRYGMVVVSARMGTTEAVPTNERSLSLWNSPADFVRLIDAVRALKRADGAVVWAVSDNTRRWVRLDAGHDIGFHPQDDAEDFAAELGNPAPLPLDTLLAGGFIDSQHPLGEMA